MYVDKEIKISQSLVVLDQSRYDISKCSTKRIKIIAPKLSSEYWVVQLIGVSSKLAFAIRSGVDLRGEERVIYFSTVLGFFFL